MKYFLFLLSGFVSMNSFSQKPPKKTKQEVVYFITRISPGVYDTLKVSSPTKSNVKYYYDTTTSLRKFVNR